MRVREIGAIPRQSPRRAQDVQRIERRHWHDIASGEFLAMWPPRHQPHPAARRNGLLPLDGASLARRRRRLPQPRHHADGRTDRPPRDRASRHHVRRQRDRHVVGQLRHRPQGAELVGDRIETARVHDPRPGRCRQRVVLQVHAVDELRLAGQVHVVAAGRGARGDERLAELGVGADGRDHDPRRLRDRADRYWVVHIGHQQRQRHACRRRTREARTHRLEPRDAPASQAPSGPWIGVRREVLGRQPAGEPGRPEQDDVEPVLSHPRRRVRGRAPAPAPP